MSDILNTVKLLVGTLGMRCECRELQRKALDAAGRLLARNSPSSIIEERERHWTKGEHGYFTGSYSDGGGSSGGKTLDKSGGSGIIKSRNRVGSPVKPIEKTLDMALNPETYAFEVAKKYKINLKAGGKPVEVVYDDSLVQYGKTFESEPHKIRLGHMAYINEEELANTIAHELNHCRSFARGGNAPEATAYAAGESLAAYIRGER